MSDLRDPPGSVSDGRFGLSRRLRTARRTTKDRIAVLDAYIIEEIKRQEEERRRHDEDRPRLEIEIPRPARPSDPPRDDDDEGDDEGSTVIRIDL